MNGGCDVEPRHALADVDVEVVERARGDVDQHLARAGLRVVDLLDLQHVQPAELVKDAPPSLHDLRCATIE